MKKHGLSERTCRKYVNYSIESSLQVPYKKINEIERKEIEKDLPRLQSQVKQISTLVEDGQVIGDVDMET